MDRSKVQVYFEIGKLYKYHLTITDMESKLLNDRDGFLLVLSVI